MQERRKHVRHLAENLQVLIDGKAYPLINISTGGVYFQGQGFYAGNPLSLVIRSLHDEKDSVATVARVVAVTDSAVHAEFTKANVPLLNFVIGHIGQAMGVKPHFFKKPTAQGNVSQDGA